MNTIDLTKKKGFSEFTTQFNAKFFVNGHRPGSDKYSWQIFLTEEDKKNKQPIAHGPMGTESAKKFANIPKKDRAKYVNRMCFAPATDDNSICILFSMEYTELVDGVTVAL